MLRKIEHYFVYRNVMRNARVEKEERRFLGYEKIKLNIDRIIFIGRCFDRMSRVFDVIIMYSIKYIFSTLETIDRTQEGTHLNRKN